MVEGSGRRLALVAVDQGISAASNVAVTIAAAHFLSPAAFGYFALSFIAYTLVVAFTRSGVGEPLLSMPGGEQDRRGDVLLAAGTIGVVGGALVVAIGIVGALLGAPWWGSLTVIGLALPLLTMQDVGRYLAFAAQRPINALRLDLVWLGLTAVSLTVLANLGYTSLVWFTAAWAGSGAVAGAGAWWGTTVHSLRGGYRWLRHHWSLSWRYLVGFLASQGSAVLASVLIVAWVGPAGLGSVRAVLVLFGPVVQLQVAVMSSSVAEIAGLTPRDSAVARHVWRAVIVMAVMAIGSTTVLLALPDSIGTIVLGDSWALATVAILPLGTVRLLMGIVGGPRAAMLGFQRVDTTMRLDLAMTALILGGTAVGALLGGLPGSMWGQVAGAFPIAVAYWWLYLRMRRAPAGKHRSV